MGRLLSGRQSTLILLAGSLLGILAPAAARAEVMTYDSSSGQLPGDPFRYVDTSSLFSSAVTPTISDDVASLGPTTDLGRSFWYTDQDVLPHDTGFVVSATLKLDSESSTDPIDQSGLAIAFSDDRALYQNLFIDPSGVFFSKLNPSQTSIIPDTSFSMDTAVWNTYTIQVLGDDVTLSVNGTPEIASTLFNLSATGELVLPDYAALGDISPAAQSQFDFTTFSVVVPEPSYAAATAIAIAIIVATRLRRSHLQFT
jgi:hypothetical protein